MVAITDIPFVVPLAEWIWATDDNVSPETCLSLLPFLNSDCLSQLLTKALGVMIILGSCLNKIPIMKNMLDSQSASGIARNSLYGESLVYANGCLYGILQEHPLTSYGENASLLIQNLILILMVWQFSATPVTERALATCGLVLYGAVMMYLLPDDYRYLLITSNWPVMLYARGSQVWETHVVKHTGNLSIVTTTMNVVGALIRIGTTMKETGDTIVLSGYLLSFGLSFTMFVQYFMYLEKTKQMAADVQESKKEK